MSVCRLPLLCAVLCLPSLAPAQTPVTFLQPESLGSCSAVAAADFNGDGNLDVACAGTTLTIWLGDGKGRFRQTRQTLPYENALIVAGDFNGDGRPDLVVGNSQLILLPGNGDGTFGTQILIADLSPTALVATDLNLDGHLDLLVCEANTGAVDAFLGNGDGTFQNQIATGMTAAQYTNIAVADFNGDGIPDAASINIPDNVTTIQVALGKGDGTFGSIITTAIPDGVAPFVVADFTGDGKQDVALGYSAGIYVFKGNGDGTLSPGPITRTQGGAVLFAADLNGDGQPDVVMNGMGVAINKGGGAFSPTKWYQNDLANGGVAGYFRNPSSNDVFVSGDFYENDGSGNFVAPRAYPTGCNNCWTLATADFNNDGNLDAAIVSGNEVRIYAGSGNGKFTGYGKTGFTLNSSGTVGAAAAGDFNGDGKLDLALASVNRHHGGGEAAIMLGNGDGTLQPPTAVYTAYGVDDLAVADFNGDGRSDLALATGVGIVVMCGNRRGGFTTTAAIKNLASSGSIVTADFNHDSIVDFATASDIFLGNGDGTFHHAYSLPQPGTIVQTGDLNSDGISDLVTSDGYNIIFWPGVGDGTFGLPITIANLYAPIFRVADLNGDGISDVAVTWNGSNAITVYFGSATGTFTSETLINLPLFGLEPLAAGAFNNSALIDLLTVDDFGRLMVLNSITH